MTPEEMQRLRSTVSQLVDHSKEDRKVMEEYLGVPVNHLARKVKIFKPEKSAAQHGYSAAQSWVLQFNPGDKWTNPLMGWTSSRDPLEYLNLKFPTKEAAIAFSQEQGFEVEVEEEEHTLRKNERSYGNKFKHIPQSPKHISDF
uniref:NADH dehydrogenase [ubiquinone] iron-sulfur protein 4, mitochondrial n=1 Tax=Arcella intermedia TaxID=1963864 RepID=A0A6B2LP32_9EUKA